MDFLIHSINRFCKHKCGYSLACNTKIFADLEVVLNNTATVHVNETLVTKGTIKLNDLWEVELWFNTHWDHSGSTLNNMLP